MADQLQNYIDGKFVDAEDGDFASLRDTLAASK